MGKQSDNTDVQALRRFIGTCIVSDFFPSLDDFQQRFHALVFELAEEKSPKQRHQTYLREVEDLKGEARYGFPKRWFSGPNTPPEFLELGKAIRSAESALSQSLSDLQVLGNPTSSEKAFQEQYDSAKSHLTPAAASALKSTKCTGANGQFGLRR